MRPGPREIRFLEVGERCPFLEWYDNLSDANQAAVHNRLNRARLGLFGDWKALRAGIFEMRLPVGGGLRVYFAEDGKGTILLITGGTKSRQDRDIARAVELYNARERVKNG